MNDLIDILKISAVYTLSCLVLSFCAFWIAFFATIFLNVFWRFFVLLFFVACCVVAVDKYLPQIKALCRKMKLPTWSQYRTA